MISNLAKLNNIENATRLIVTGQESLESCSERFGRNWPAIEVSVKLSIKLTKLGQQYHESVANKLQREVVSSRLKKYMQDERTSVTPVSLNCKKRFGFAGGLLRKAEEINFTRKLLAYLAGIKPGIIRSNPIVKIIILVVVILLGSGLFCGMAEASQPGDLFYPTKLQLEKIPSIWMFTSEAKNKASLDYAQSRIAEIERALEKDPTTDLTQAFASYQEAVDEVIPGNTPEHSRDVVERIAQQQIALQKLEQKSNQNSELLKRIKLLEQTYQARQAQTTAQAKAALASQNQPRKDSEILPTPTPTTSEVGLVTSSEREKEIAVTPKVESGITKGGIGEENINNNDKESNKQGIRLKRRLALIKQAESTTPPANAGSTNNSTNSNNSDLTPEITPDANPNANTTATAPTRPPQSEKKNTTSTYKLLQKEVLSEKLKKEIEQAKEESRTIKRRIRGF